MAEWIDYILQLDEQLFTFLNSRHLPLFDTLMVWATNKYFWIPLYLLVVLFILQRYRWSGVYIIATIILVAILTDQITSSFMKPYFQRLRPCYDIDLQETIHLMKRCGGRYGFASSHAANTFGLATFIWLIFGSRYRTTAAFFFWAALVAYSRIYVGVHYPLDIVVGAIVGSLTAWLIYRLFNLANKKYGWVQAEWITRN